MKTLSPVELARRIERMLVRPGAMRRDIEQLCAEARAEGSHCVCVNGSHVELACALLEDSEVKVVAVAGFPLGAMEADAKRYEVEAAVDAGAQELDVVLNLGRLKDSATKFVLRELRDVVEAAQGMPVKVIIETCLLTDEEKRLACGLVVESGASFVKTSTGFGPGGATVADVRLLRKAVGPEFGVKASGGIRTLANVKELLEAGATRIGASASVAIVRELGAE